MLFQGAFSELLYSPLQESKLPSQSFTISKPRSEVFQASLSALQALGYQIKDQQPDHGRIETAFKPMTSSGWRAFSGALSGYKGMSDAWIVEMSESDQATSITLRIAVMGEFVIGKPTYEYGVSKSWVKQKTSELIQVIQRHLTTT